MCDREAAGTCTLPPCCAHVIIAAAPCIEESTRFKASPPLKVHEPRSRHLRPEPPPAVDNVAAVHGRAGQHHRLIRQSQQVVQAADCSIQVFRQQGGSRCGDGSPPCTPRRQQRCGTLAGSAAAAGCWRAGKVLHPAHGEFGRHAAGRGLGAGLAWVSLRLRLAAGTVGEAEYVRLKLVTCPRAE